MRGVLPAIQRAGGMIFEDTAFEKVADDGVTVHAGGHTIRCRYLVIATHNPLMGKQGALTATLFQTRLSLYTSYVLGAHVPQGTVPDALFWDTNDPYEYLRTLPRDDGQYVIFGGKDVKTGQEKDTAAPGVISARTSISRITSCGNQTCRYTGDGARIYSGRKNTDESDRGGAMWTRRRFLQSSSLAVAAMTCIRADAARTRGPLGRPIGLQIYTVREAAAKDLPGTLKAIADIGYTELELAGPARPVAEMRALLAAAGLSVPSMHSNMADLQSNAQQRIDYARALGAQYLVCSFPSTAAARSLPGGALGAAMTLDDWKWNAEQLNRFGELARKAGVRFGYHNHNMEFRSFDGVVAFDELLRLTDPALVSFELDIAWVVTAGQDPAACLKKHADRITQLHVKDVRKDLRVTTELQAQTTEVGNGAIDWKALFAAADPRRIQHCYVEQENFDRSPLESIRISFDYLSRLGAQS